MATSAYDEMNLIRVPKSNEVAKLMGPKEVSSHDSDSDCYVIIDSKVYDVTDFLSQHPGGADKLLLYAGRDATAAFNELGHSSEARGMLKKYFVANLLAHGYDQSAKSEGGPDASLGDTSAPYLLFKTYFKYTNPLFPMLISSQVCYRLLKILMQPSDNMLQPALSVYLRLLGVAVLILLAIATPIVQNFIQSCCKIELGPQVSHFSARGLRYAMSWRIQVASLAMLFFLVGELFIIQKTETFSVLRTSLLLSSLFEFAIGDVCSLIRIPSLHLSCDPCAWLRGFVYVLENSNHRAQLFLIFSVIFDILGASFSSGANSHMLLILLSVGLARSIFLRSLETAIGALQGDYIAVSLMVSFSSFIYCTATMAFLTRSTFLEVVCKHVFVDTWSFGFEGVVFTVSIASSAAFVSWSRASFSCHVYGLGNAGLLWFYNPPSINVSWIPFIFYGAAIQGL